MVHAAPLTYTIDSAHTYPSFEADHMGFSLWRGKVNSTTGKIVMDKAAKTGTVEVSMDMSTIDFGHDGLNEHIKRPDFLDTAKYPTATFTGKLAGWKGDAPTEVQGELTMRGVTKPVTVTINNFICKPHPMRRREACGADAVATINREDFGMAYGKQMGFDMGVKIQISIEAPLAAEPAAAQ